MTFCNFPPKQKFLGFTTVLIVVFCCFSGYAADNPGERFFNALTCFSNKFIYSGCNEAYRLNESGNLNVPPDALDLFCHGPCLAETQQVLKCVDSMLSTFIFNNKATTADIRGALHDGCSYTSQRDDDKLPTSRKKGWKHLRRIFKSFKSSDDDYYNNYYKYHVHYDDYKKQQQRRGSAATNSSAVEDDDEKGKAFNAACEEFIERLHARWMLESQKSAQQASRDMLDPSA
ncbi:PREDICTED: uncharacterized protein LOC101301706 [Fragaria vesca subsp. vesca]|uniref:uncharacterized protein LOC101301706 n=1 Tax=Fragaria vesca subsp. vesca TaxID=101020 RepID=UPI0002C35FC6|nr:PREDICTED: uncharacterized protein LOC101301706 [Fragaria vesca subsp. vesca]